MQLMGLGVQAHKLKLERKLRTHQPACSSPGLKVTRPISWGHGSDLSAENHQHLGKSLWLLKQLVCAVKGHSGLLSWMEGAGDIT